MAFLEGQAAIRYPVAADRRPRRATPSSRTSCPSPPATASPAALVPFPPLPAVAPAAVRRALGPRHRRPADLRDPRRARRRARLVGARPAADPDVGPGRGHDVFFGFGTVFWYAAQIGTTWYQAHVLAVGLALLAIGVALGADRRAAFRDDGPSAGRGRRRPREQRPPRSAAAVERARATRPRAALVPDGRQFLAGVPLRAGLHVPADGRVRRAVLPLRRARGGSWLRRGWSAALGAGIPLAAARRLQPRDDRPPAPSGLPAPVRARGRLLQPLNYHLDWEIEDIRYLPQNFAIMFLNTPGLAAGRRPVGARHWAGRSARARTPSAACSTPTARWSCRGTPA